MTVGRSGIDSTTGVRQTVPDAILYADPDGGEIVAVEGGVGALFGYEPEALVGRPQTDLHPPDDRAAYRQLFETHLTAEPAVIDQFEDGSPVYVYTADGERVPVEINAWTVERDGRTLFQGVFRDISPRLRLEQYREAVESTANPIAAVDADYRYLFANRAYCEPLRYDPADIVGKTVESVLGTSVFEAIEPKLVEGLGGQTCQYETSRTFPSGEQRDFEATYSPLRTEDGEVYGLIASFNDVTERKQREAELERLFDGMDDAAFLHHLDGRFQVVNETAVERYGYTEDEFYEMSPRELDAGPDAEKVGERIEEIHETGSDVFETVHESKDGEQTPVEISSSLIQYKGEPAILSIARDISRRKESERKFEVLFNNASDAMVHTAFREGEPIVQGVNPAFTELFGYDESALVGRSLAEIFDTRATAYEMGEINRRIREGDPLRLEIQRQTPDGARDFLLRSIPVDPDAGEYYRVYTDITERKERERTLVRQRDELGTLNRLNELILTVIQELVAADSRGAIEDVVCRELASSPLFEFAWIAEPDPETGEATMRTCSSEDVAFESLGGFDAEGTETEFGPAGRALEQGEIQVVQNTSADPRFFGESGGKVDPDVRSIAAVPLAQEDSVYATLVIYAPREFAFSGRELAGLETLGKIVEFAINAVRNRKLLTTDTVAELEFDVEGATLPLVELSADLDCQIELDGSVRTGEGEQVTLYLHVSGVEPEPFLAALRAHEMVERVARLGSDTEDGFRIEARMDCGLYRDLESHHKATVRTIELDGGAGRYVIDAPLTEDVREIVDRLQATYPAVSFKAKREREERIENPARMAEALESELTDRQTEILHTALLAGYFEWPRDSSAEDVAETVGITSSTLQYHLRNAQKTVFSRLFGQDL